MADRLEQEREVVPLVEENALVIKRRKLTEGVRVRTVVRERDEVVDEPLATEEVEVERAPLDRWVDAPVPVRQEGDTTIVTLIEEVVVVEKRLRAVEEIRVTRRRAVRHAPQHVTLRREEAVIERLDAGGEAKDDPSEPG
jgi:stress response protein YsnF